MRHIYRGEIGEIKWRNARMSCAYALMAMRTKAGISRKMMAAALGYSSRCIFVHRNGKQRKDPYACPSEIRGGDGIAFQGVNRSEEEETRNFQKKNDSLRNRFSCNSPKTERFFVERRMLFFQLRTQWICLCGVGYIIFAEDSEEGW